MPHGNSSSIMAKAMAETESAELLTLIASEYFTEGLILPYFSMFLCSQ
jgi:hypothetical protein